MKKFFTWMCAGLAVVLLSGCRSSESVNKKNCSWGPVPGKYKTVVYSSGSSLPGATIIKKMRSGKLTGEYYFMEKGKKKSVRGSLSDFVKLDAHTLRCKWQDKYGEGPLVMVFNQDFSFFKGNWHVNGKEEKFNWNGVRQ